MASRAVVLVATIVVAAALGVSVGGAVLAGLGLSLAVISAVVAVTWRKRRKPALAVVAWTVAAIAAAGAVVGFVDAVS